MQDNILKSVKIVKVFLDFNDGKGIHRREEVILRFMDNSQCVFAGPAPANFKKPGQVHTIDFTLVLVRILL